MVNKMKLKLKVLIAKKGNGYKRKGLFKTKQKNFEINFFIFIEMYHKKKVY